MDIEKHTKESWISLWESIVQRSKQLSTGKFVKKTADEWQKFSYELMQKLVKKTVAELKSEIDELVANNKFENKKLLEIFTLTTPIENMMTGAKLAEARTWLGGLKKNTLVTWLAEQRTTLAQDEEEKLAAASTDELVLPNLDDNSVPDQDQVDGLFDNMECDDEPDGSTAMTLALDQMTHGADEPSGGYTHLLSPATSAQRTEAMTKLVMGHEASAHLLSKVLENKLQDTGLEHVFIKCTKRGPKPANKINRVFTNGFSLDLVLHLTGRVVTVPATSDGLHTTCVNAGTASVDLPESRLWMKLFVVPGNTAAELAPGWMVRTVRPDSKEVATMRPESRVVQVERSDGSCFDLKVTYLRLTEEAVQKLGLLKPGAYMELTRKRFPEEVQLKKRKIEETVDPDLGIAPSEWKKMCSHLMR